jgi:hypothetical protein
MRGVQCNVEFMYQLSICSRTEENHGKTWPSWQAAGLSFPIRTDFQSAVLSLNTRALTVVPVCAVALSFKIYRNFLQCFFCAFLMRWMRKEQLGSLLIQLQFMYSCVIETFSVFLTASGCQPVQRRGWPPVDWTLWEFHSWLVTWNKIYKRQL